MIYNFLKESSLFSNHDQASTSNTGNLSGYSSFRDEINKQIFNNPFDFNESFDEDHEDDEPKVIILEGSNY
jgi:hypothetical protein